MEYQMLRGRQPKELLRIPSPSGDWECQIIASFPEFHGTIAMESVLISRWLVDYPEESKRKMRLYKVKSDLLELSEAHLKAVRRYLVDVFALPL